MSGYINTYSVSEIHPLYMFIHVHSMTIIKNHIPGTSETSNGVLEAIRPAYTCTYTHDMKSSNIAGECQNSVLVAMIDSS